MRRLLPALALAAGFHLLSLAAAAGLALLAVLDFRSPPFVLGGLCISAAISVLAATLPRIRRSDLDGVVVTAAEAPHLHALVAEVVHRGGFAAPDEVRVVVDDSAWAADLGGRKVIALGLPYLVACDADALRSVIAHELAHHDHGDSLLTRRFAWLRAKVTEDLGSTELWRAPYRWYARRFWAMSAAWSRDRERRADARAVAIVGAPARWRALAGVLPQSTAWDRFWKQRVRPALEAGLRPPLAAGFRHALDDQVLRAEAWHEAVECFVAPTTDSRYDSHPALAARLAAVGAPVLAWPQGGDAILIAELAGIEEALLAQVAGPERVAALRPVTVDELEARRATAAQADLDSASAPAPLPRLPRWETALTTPARTRVGAALVLLLALTTILPMALYIGAQPFLGTLPDTTIAVALSLGIALLGVGATAFVVHRQARALGRPGRLVIDHGQLVVDHPRLLREPLVLALTAVRVVAVDTDADGAVRFPVLPSSPWNAPTAGGAAAVGALWHAEDGATVPLYGVTPDAPNVAVVLEEPVAGPPVRRATSYGPLTGERLETFLLRVGDAEGLAAHLAPTRLVRELRVDDLDRRDPTMPAARAA